MNLDYDLKGMPRIEAKLAGPEPVYFEPWRRLMERGAELMKGEGEKRAPERSGALRASITTKLDTSPLPKWAMVKTDMAGRSGGRYGFILDASKTAIYRGGRYAKHGKKRGGKRTYRWFRGVLPIIKRQLKPLFDACAKEVGQLWGH